jgi:hypothetical protein
MGKFRSVIMCIIIVQMHLCKLLYACGGAFLCGYEVSMPFSDLKQNSLFFFFFFFPFLFYSPVNVICHGMLVVWIPFIW